jgi:hypothetical protein
LNAKISRVERKEIPITKTHMICQMFQSLETQLYAAGREKFHHHHHHHCSRLV